MGLTPEKSAVVKAKVSFDNGNVLDYEFPNLKPEVAVELLKLLQSHKMEQSDV